MAPTLLILERDLDAVGLHGGDAAPRAGVRDRREAHRREIDGRDVAAVARHGHAIAGIGKDSVRPALLARESVHRAAVRCIEHRKRPYRVSVAVVDRGDRVSVG